jgi:hypothetical protein
MNGRIIADALAVNPLAEFACKPKPGELKAVRVRDLRRISDSTWSVAESTDPITGAWRKNTGSLGMRLLSRNLVTVEDAETQVEETLSRNATHADESRKARVLVQQLEKLGISCRQMDCRVIVHDVALLGRLLAKVPT